MEWRKKGKVSGPISRNISEKVERRGYIFYVNGKGDLVKTNIETYKQS